MRILITKLPEAKCGTGILYVDRILLFKFYLRSLFLLLVLAQPMTVIGYDYYSKF